MFPPRSAALWAIGILALASPAAAEDKVADAKVLFERGLAALEHGDLATACPAFDESQRLDPRPGTMFSLATCEARRGRVATAATLFRQYILLYEALSDEQKKRQGKRPDVAREERDKATPQIPTLTLTLAPGAPDGTVVKVDGVVAALGVALPMDPGEVVVSIQAPGGPAEERRVTVVKGEKTRLILDVRPAAATPPAPKAAVEPAKVTMDAPIQGPSGRRKAAYALGGVGLAGLAVGFAMGGLTLAQKGTVSQHCGSGIGQKDETACDQTGLDAAHRASTFGLVSTIGVAAGLGGLGTGIVMWATERRSDPGRAASERRILPGLLSVGFRGVVLGAQGVW